MTASLWELSARGLAAQAARTATTSTDGDVEDAVRVPADRVREVADGIFSAPVLVAVGILIVAYLLSRLTRRLVKRAVLKAERPNSIAAVFSRLSSWAVMLLGIGIAAVTLFPSFNVATLAGSLGLGTVLVGFALRGIFENMVSGVMILLQRPFVIGDQIVSEEHEGVVEDIQIRATYLRTYDNQRVVIPNSDLYTGRVPVKTAYNSRRVSVELSVRDSTQVEHVRELVLERMKDIEGVQQNPQPELLLTDVDAGAPTWTCGSGSPPPRGPRPTTSAAGCASRWSSCSTSTAWTARCP